MSFSVLRSASPKAPATERRKFRDLDAEAPRATPDEIRAWLSDVASPAAEPGEPSSHAESIARAAETFLDRGSSLRREAARGLVLATGFPAPVAEEAIDRVFAPLASAEEVLDAAGAGRLRAFPATAILAAGNVPGVALPKACLALVGGGACLVKVAAGEPVLAPLFHDALAAVDPALASRLHVAWWPGGDRAWETALAGTFDAIVAYGSDETIASLERLGARQFTPHGHRTSGAVLESVDRSDPEVVRGLAVDVSLYDQAGCLSPQFVVLVGASAEDAAAFCDALASELDALADAWPPGDAEGAAVDVRRFLDEGEWRGLGGAPVRVWGSGVAPRWGIVLDTEAGRYRTGRGSRTIRVYGARDVAAFEEAIAASGLPLECLGVGPRAAVSRDAAARRAPRVAVVGQMQAPRLDWRQGGLDPWHGVGIVR